jgi:SAM-dependent methyltransferase
VEDPTPLRDNRFALDHQITIGWCPVCGLGVTLDPPDRAALAGLYEASYDSDAEFEESGTPRTGRLAAVWHRLNGSLPFSDLTYREPILDVGSNRGDLLLALQARGLRGVGLESNTVAARFSRSRGIEVIEGSVEEVDLPTAHFRSVILSQVLEHVHDPHGVLSRLRNAAAEDASLYILVPNAGSFWRRVFRSDWVHWHVPFHLYHHTERSLALLLEQSGFRPTAVRTITPGEWLILSMHARHNARHGIYRLDHFAGRYLERLALAPLARIVDALHRGDAIFMRAVRA